LNPSFADDGKRRLTFPAFIHASSHQILGTLENSSDVFVIDHKSPIYFSPVPF
jgi:hypothetical protein